MTKDENLRLFVSCWQKRDPGKRGKKWPQYSSVLELIYSLVHYYPDYYDSPMGQIFLEVFTRQITACINIGKFGGDFVHDSRNEKREKNSIQELLRLFLEPIALGSIDLSEDLLESFPRSFLPIISIHQSKGLEFPLTIVDVGSDFKINAKAQRRNRFPEEGEVVHAMEDEFRVYSESIDPSDRSQIDRAFDDLFRKYFVGFSRAQDVLLLVGLTKTYPSFSLPNVAIGWDRRGSIHWTNTTLMEI